MSRMSFRLSSTTSEETTVSLTSPSPTTPPSSSPPFFQPGPHPTTNGPIHHHSTPSPYHKKLHHTTSTASTPPSTITPIMRRISSRRFKSLPPLSPLTSPIGSPYHSPITGSPRSPASPLSPRSPRGSRPTSPCPNSPGSHLGYLASRRASRDSEAEGPVDSCRSRGRRPSNFLELPVPDHFRARIGSLPEQYNPRAGDQIYRLRTFSITSKGIINRGDSIISRRSRSNTSVCTSASRNSSRHSSRSGKSGERSPFDGSCCGSSYVSSESITEVAKYRVVLLGESGVGKTALVSQFMTSDYMNTYDASLDDEFGEKSVSILLDDEETEVIFIDHPSHEMSVENCLTTYDPHACIVVYSVTDRGTFKKAEDIMNYIWTGDPNKVAVILVANKVDLVRSRSVTIQEGKLVAKQYEAKYIETSSGIQHNVDELLVGVVKQVRLRLAAKKREMKKLSMSRTSLSLQAAKDILNKMCSIDTKSKSCENLHKL